MGLFDDIEVDREMPDGYRCKNFQTKDLECCMGRYRITPDGFLERYLGESKKWQRVPFHGIIHFYDLDEDHESEWHPYLAKFADGLLVSIEVDDEDE